MLFPFALWLWAMFFAAHPNTPNTTARHSPTPSRPVVLGDSSVYRHLAARLAERRAETKPEKLYLHLDRTLLQPGDTLWFNAYLRHAGNLKPSATSDILYVELLSPQQVVLLRKTIVAENGTAAGEFDLEADWPGGLYKIKAYTNWMRNTDAAFERTVTLQKTVLPNLNLRLQFERKAFGPGDVVIARLDASALDNRPLADRTLQVSAQVAGQTVHHGEARTDAAGRAYVQFPLPADLATTDGLLHIQIEHEGRPEAISRAIPIVLNRIDLRFFPEGGDLVAGLPGRVAFEALNEFGKPADVAGEVLDDAGTVVARFESFHDGMGAFDLTPAAGVAYTARLIRPVETPARYALPAAQPAGYQLHVEKQSDNALHVAVSGTGAGKVFLVATARDDIFFFREITLPHSTTSRQPSAVKIPTRSLPPGIVRVTLFDANAVEQAERLAFVNRDRGLQVEIKPDREQYLPRDRVRLDVRVRDAAGKPVPGQFSLAVTDENLLTFADDKQGHLLAALLLEQDVQGKIEEPNFYFDRSEPKSAAALDYLLMTRGWRRFTWQDIREATPVANAHAAERAVVSGTMVKANGKPYKNQTVKLHPNGPTQKTDKDGRFSFERPDLNRYTHLAYGERQYFPLKSYQQNIVLPGGGYVGAGWAHTTEPSANGTLLRGTITDDMGEELIGATIKVFQNGQLVRGVITDYNGDYRIALEPGIYSLEYCYTGYNNFKTPDIPIEPQSRHTIDVTMENGNVLQEVTITAYQVPLIKQDKTQGGQTLTSEQIRNLPTRSVNATAAMAPKPSAKAASPAEVSVRGSRSAATEYYIDGVRVAGANEAQAERSSIGLPASIAGRYNAQADTDDRLAKKKMPTRTAPRPIDRYARARQFYVPRYDQQQQPETRTDFRSTIYWNPAVRTDAEGRAHVEFFASDAVTNFRATVEGIADAGIAARAQHQFFVQKPLAIALKTPPSVIAGDVLRLQIAVSNRSQQPVEAPIALDVPAHFSLQTPAPPTVRLASGETRVVPVEYAIGQPDHPQVQPLRVRFGAADAYEATIATLHRGFPVQQVLSGTAAQNRFDLHFADPVPGSMSIKLTAYGSVLDDVLQGMERMLRQPTGCFEQVSSSNYPNLLVLDLLRQTRTIRPDVEARALQLLEDGYKRLAAYECKDGGFDWWGRSPAHEGLTAYGILQFGDMARVYPQVDKALTERSVRWLLSRRDGQGGWKRRDDWHGWQSTDVIGAYIAWAVSEAGFGQQFQPEITAAFEAARTSGDPYQLALVANALLAQQDPRAGAVLALLLEKQDEKGHWTGLSHSVMGGRGDALRIETTALAALALMKSGTNATALDRAMGFIMAAKTPYGYGSTQSTVLALKALVQYAQQASQQPTDGLLVVQVDGKRVAEHAFSSSNPHTFEVEHLEKHIVGDRARVEVFFEKKSLPFDIAVQYASRLPRNAPNSPFAFETRIVQPETRVGNTVRLSAELRNTSGDHLASPMVILGIPAGLSLQPWQLKKLVDEKKCDFYELWDGFAVFHFEGLPPGETRRLDLDLRADIPGAYEAPAAQAFLYYDNDQRVWSKPERVVVR